MQPEQPLDELSVGSINAPGSTITFALSSGEASCLLQRGPAGGNSGELVGYGCDDILPALASGLHWIDRADGSVAFQARDGRPVAEFAAGDGADYESFSPREPILTLVERR